VVSMIMNGGDGHVALGAPMKSKMMI